MAIAPSDDAGADAGTAPRSGISRAELRGRATGVGFMAFFGLGWTACGVTDLPITVGRAVFAVAVLVSITFAVLGSRMSRAAATAPTDGEPTPAQRRRWACVSVWWSWRSGWRSSRSPACWW